MTEYYDDEPDGEAFVEETKPTGDGIKIEINQWAMERIEAAAMAGVRQEISSKIDKIIEVQIADIVTARLDEVVGKIAEDAILAYLTKPRRKTNVYGEEMGGDVTLAEQIPAKVEGWLNEKVNYEGRRADYYDKKAQTRVDFIINKTVTTELDIATKAAAAQVTERAKKVVAAHVGRFVAEQMIPQIDVSKTAA